MLPAPSTDVPPCALAECPIASPTIIYTPYPVTGGMPGKRLMITGPIGSGKTTLAKELARLAARRGMRVGGVLSLRLMEGPATVGYNLVDIESGRSMPMAIPEDAYGKYNIPPGDAIAFGPDLFGGRPCRYHFSIKAFELGNGILRDMTERLDEHDMIVIDEIGFLELRGEGLREGVELVRRARSFQGVLIVVVRDFLRRDVSRLFELPFHGVELAKGPDKTLEIVLDEHFSSI